MREVERSSDLDTDLENGVDRKLPVPIREPFPQRAPGHPAENAIQGTIGRPGTDDRDDVGMGERLRQPNFSEESFRAE